MKTFPRPLHFDNAGMINGGRRIVLTKSFEAYTSLGIVRAPVGFICDGASIPRVAWSIIGSPFDEYLEEAVIHDFLYSEGNNDFSRAEADLIFKELMWNNDVSKIKLATMYSMVRLFGGRSFKSKKSKMPTFRI